MESEENIKKTSFNVEQSKNKRKKLNRKKNSFLSKIILSFILIFIIIIGVILIYYFSKLYIYNSKLNSNNKNNENVKVQNMNTNSTLNQINSFSVTTESINVKSNYIAKIRHYQNETLVYKKIKNITSIIEVDNENTTKEIITTSYILFHINDVIYKESEQTIFIANILILNSTIKDDNIIYPSGGINILNDFENKSNDFNENEENIEYTEYGENIDIELNNFDELKNYNFSKYIPKINNTNTNNDDFDNITKKFISNLNIPIMNFSFYESGKIINVSFSENLDDLMIQLLNGSLYDLIPDISLNSNLRLLQNEEKGNESKFQKEQNEKPNILGIPLKNCEMNSISNNTIDNNLESLTQISSIGEAMLMSDNEDQIDDEDIEINPFKDDKSNIIPNNIKKMFINESSNISLVWSSRNESIHDIINFLNQKVNYTQDYTFEKNLTLRLLNKYNLSIDKYEKYKRELKELENNKEFSKFTKEIQFDYKIFKVNLFGVKFALTARVKGSTTESKILVQVIFNLLENEIPIFFKTYSSNIGSVIFKYINSINDIAKKLLEQYEFIRVKIKNVWSNGIKEKFKQLSGFVKNVFDISKLYNNPIKEISNTFIKHSKDIFNGIKNIIHEKLDEFIKISYNLSKGYYTIIKDMIKDIQEQYKDLINNAKDFATNIQQSGINFINNIIQQLEHKDTFDLPLMYAIYDQLQRPVEFLNKYERNIFSSIKKGIDNAMNDIISIQQNIIGNGIFKLESIINSLMASPILKEGISFLERLNIKKNISSIIEEIDNQVQIIKNQINDNYLQDMNKLGKQLTMNLEKNISFFTNQSNNLIKEIKSKIESIELMELYSSHLDIIDSIENNILLTINNKFYDLFSTYQDYLLIYKLNEELIINSINDLKSSSNNIISIIKNEINEMKKILEDVKINLSEEYRLNLGDIGFHLMELVTKEDLETLVNNYYNLLNTVLDTMKDRDNKNYGYLFTYLNNVLDAFASGRSRQCQGGVPAQIYQYFFNKNQDFQDFVTKFFEKVMKNKYFYIYNSIIDIFDSKIFKKIDRNNYNNDEHLYFASGFLDYLQSIKDLIHQYISEEIFENQVSIDIQSKYILNFTNNSFILMNDANNTYKKINSIPFDGECDKDYCWKVKNNFMKRHMKGKKYKMKGYNVNGRNGYQSLVTSFPENTFDEQTHLIFENFISKYRPTILQYESIIEIIENKIKETKKEIIIKYNNTEQFNNVIELYKNKVSSLANLIIGKEPLTKIYNYLTTNIENKITKYYSSISSFNDKFLDEFYQKNFKNSFNKYLQKPEEIIKKFTEIGKKIENIGNDFSKNIYDTLNSQLNTEIQFLFHKFSDGIEENVNELLRDFPSFDYPEITETRKQIINQIPNYVKSILNDKLEIISSKTNLANILEKNENDIFEINSQIENYNKKLYDSFLIPFNYIKNDISSYVDKTIKDVIKKNSIITKIYQSKYAFDFIKKFSDSISNNNILKNFKKTDYLSLFKEFATYNIYPFIDEIKNSFEEEQTKIINYIQVLIDQIVNDVQGLFNQNIMNTDSMMEKLNNFIENGFNNFNWQNKSIENSLENFEKKIHNIFIKEKDKFIKKYQFKNFIFNETNMNLTYFKIKNNLLNPIRNLINNNYKYTINLEVIHCLINETQKIMRDDTKKLVETLEEISNKIGKIPLLGKDLNLGEIIKESLWPKIFDYSNGIFFNYTKYFRGIKNLKIDISEIKYYLIEKEEQLSTILDDEYFVLLNIIKEKAIKIIGEPKEEEKFKEEEHEIIEEEEQKKEENKTINFNNTNIDDPNVEYEDEVDNWEERYKKEDEEDEQFIIDFCNNCTLTNNTFDEELCPLCDHLDELDEDEDEDENENEIENNDINDKVNKKNINLRKFNISNNDINYLLRNLNINNKRYLDDELIFDDFSEYFFNEAKFLGNILSNEFVELFSNDKITKNILKNITHFDKDFFHIKFNLKDALSEFNFDENVDILKRIANQKINEIIDNITILLEDKIHIYLNKTLNDFSNKYGKTFIDTQIQTIIKNNLTHIFNFINEKVEDIFSYMNNLISPLKEISELIYIALLEVFENVYNYVEDNIKYFYENIINIEFDNIINDIGSSLIDYYVEMISSSQIIKDNFNDNIYDIFQSIFSKNQIKEMKKISVSILEKNNIGPFIYQFKSKVNGFLEDFKKNMKETKQNAIKEILKNTIKVPLDSKYDEISDLLTKYKTKLDDLIGTIVFKVLRIKEYYEKFLIDNIQPLIDKIFSVYNELTKKVIEIASNVIENLTKYAPLVKEKLKTDEINQLILNAEDQLDSFLDSIDNTIRKTFYIIIENTLSKVKDLFIGFGQENTYNKIMEVLKEIIKGDENIVDRINDILFKRNLRRNLEKLHRRKSHINSKLRRTSILNFNMIKKPLDDLKDQILSFTEIFKTGKEYIHLIGDFTQFKELIDYGLKHITDPIELLISQVKTFITDENQINELKNNILKDVNEIIGLYLYHKERIEGIYNRIITTIKSFPKKFTSKTIKNIFENTFDLSISILCDKIVDYLNPLKLYQKSNLPPATLFDIVIPIFFIPFRFTVDMLYEYEYGITIKSNVPKIYFGGGAGGSATIRAKAGITLGIIEFGAQIIGLLGSGNIELLANYNFKKSNVGLTFYFNINAFSFSYGGYMMYPFINFIKIKVKVGFIHIYVNFPIIVLKRKEMVGKIYTGLQYSNSYEKEL